MDREHAILSASGSSRWLSCTPSARLEQKLVENNTVSSGSNSYADEGSLAHRLAEVYLKLHLKQVTKQWFKNEMIDIQKSEYYNETMEEFISDYIAFVIETLNGYKSAICVIEDEVDLSMYIPEGFGHNDVMIFSNDVLEIIDLKYGKGVPVYADENKQLMLYALGAYEKYGFIYDIKQVKMTIYQPRINNFSSYELSIEDLLEWAEQELIPKAKLAFEGEGKFVPGSHCLFCKAKPICKANADYQMEVAKHEFAKPELIEDDEIVNILLRHKIFIDWINSVSEYALERAINHNKKWPGLKVVEGRSNRKFPDEQKVIKVLIKKGYTRDQIVNAKIKSFGDLEKLMGKITFEKTLSPLMIKPPGAPALVPIKDKRPEINSIDKAKEDFKKWIRI